MSVITNDYIRVNQYSRPGMKLTVVNKIIMHYTANPGGTARNHWGYFNTLSDRYASAHIFVDDNEALCIIPLNEVAYQANDVQKYVSGSPYRGVPALLSNANFKAIGVEMCLDKKGNITATTFNRTVDVVAELCRTHKLTVNDIVRHYDVTGKNCPAPWVKNSAEFTRFKQAVDIKLKGHVKKGLKRVWVKELKGLNIRTGDDWNTKVAFNLPYTYTAIIDYDQTKNGFVKVIWGDKEGWFSAAFDAYWFDKDPCTEYICQTGLNFRAGQDWNTKVVQSRKKGDVVRVIGQVNKWYKVVLSNGVVGYIPVNNLYLKKK